VSDNQDLPITPADDLMARIASCLPIVADASRADLMLYRFVDAQTVELVGQARPHSILPLYSELLVGQRAPLREMPAAFGQLRGLLYRPKPRAAALHGAPIMREVHPVRDPETKQVIGALSVEANALAYERHRRRSRSFQRAVRLLHKTMLRGELRHAEGLSPFGEHDGIYYVDTQRRFQYINGIALNFFRRLGYMGKLVGRRLDSLSTADDALAEQALREQGCTEREDQEQGLTWIRKAIPVRAMDDWGRYNAPVRLPGLRRRGSYPAGVLVTIRDDTEARRREQELKVKMALIQEVHHRVKNNLQTIASLLRLQSRRAKGEEVRTILQESINRILSVAVVHEFLSKGGSSAINVKEIGRRIIGQMRESLLEPGREIRFTLEGPNVYLPSRQATACALVINELLQNAVEHGFQDRSQGLVQMALVDEGDIVRIEIEDDGQGLPEGFELEQSTSLGLHIVRALVTDDLHGTLALSRREQGTRVDISFPKQVADDGQI